MWLHEVVVGRYVLDYNGEMRYRHYLSSEVWKAVLEMWKKILKDRNWIEHIDYLMYADYISLFAQDLSHQYSRSFKFLKRVQ